MATLLWEIKADPKIFIRGWLENENSVQEVLKMKPKFPKVWLHRCLYTGGQKGVCSRQASRKCGLGIMSLLIISSQILQLGIETAISRWLRNSKQRRGMTRTGRLIDLDLFPCWYLELSTFSSFDTFQSSQLLYFSTRRKPRPRFLWLIIISLLIREAAMGLSAVASLSQRSPNAERTPHLFFLQPYALCMEFCGRACQLYSSVTPSAAMQD